MIKSAAMMRVRLPRRPATVANAVSGSVRPVRVGGGGGAEGCRLSRAGRCHLLLTVKCCSQLNAVQSIRSPGCWASHGSTSAQQCNQTHMLQCNSRAPSSLKRGLKAMRHTPRNAYLRSIGVD